MSYRQLCVIRCRQCGSPSVETAGPLRADTTVLCSECGVPVATWADFVNQIRRLVDGPVAESRPVEAGRSVAHRWRRG